jgi:filamentous hemagglutinin family protein
MKSSLPIDVSSASKFQRLDYSQMFRPVALGLSFFACTCLLALPQGGEISSGQAAITTVSNTQLNIDQASQRAVINWNSFDIGAAESVKITQLNSSSALLNRVVGTNPTSIFGTITANGQVFIINPNGVLFSSTAQVDVGALVASSLSISDKDFMAGKLSFEGQGTTGLVSNEGSIQAGMVALMGGSVNNSGLIVTTKGSTALASGEAVSLDFSASGSLAVTVDKAAYDAQVKNSGVIEATGGQVIMTASTADALLKTVVNNTGVVRANSIEERNGQIIIDGGTHGLVQVGGELDVSSTSGTGGSVTVLGQNISLQDRSKIDASGAQGGGTVLVGGDYQGSNAALHNSDAVVMSSGATINADALESGTGGKVILWSEKYTNFNGTISANGGSVSGNGGLVETSSHDVLTVSGTANAFAPNGTAGTWLLDPRNVTIIDAGTGTLSSGIFTPTSDDSTISPTTIVAALNAGTNVTISTGSTGTQDGNITVSSAIAKTVGYNPTLTLSAANNIIIDAGISSSSGRLNLVLTADSDNSGAGAYTIGGTGFVKTNGGNFYAGSVSGSTDSVTSKGTAFTIDSGGYINASTGMIDVKVSGAISLADNSIYQAANNYPYYNNGNRKYYYNTLTLTGASITSSNASASTPDIYGTPVYTYLTAGTIGSAANPLKISGGASATANTLYVTNSSGSSYINQIGTKAFSNINATISSQHDQTQNFQILGDAGGDGSTGTGHIVLNTDSVGALNLANKNIDTTATGTSVTVGNSTLVTFANGSVNTGTGSFSASGNTLRSLAAPDGVGEVSGNSLNFTGTNIGILANPIEIGTGTSLTINNWGGSSYIKSIANYFANITVVATKTAGTHSILFSGGDHVDLVSDGTNFYVPTISVSRSDGSTFGGTTGIDVTEGSRNVTLVANSGSLIFADNSVNTRMGTFTGQINSSNTTGVIAAQNSYDSGATAAQITAGNVEFDIYNSSNANSSIGAGGKDIQIAQGTGAANNTLTVNTYQGGVNIHELTENHFKNVNITLNGAPAAQSVAIDLAGADDINFSDTGSLITLDASNVNLSSGNRSWNLQATNRPVQIDGVSLGTGNYTIYNGGSRLKLNSDIVTDGGAISLQSAYIDLLKSIRIDSNSDKIGSSGQITLSGNISATAASQTLVVDASTSSASNSGGYINFSSAVGNWAGHYLTGLTVDTRSAISAYDGTLDLQSNSIYTNGSVAFYGNVNDYAQTIDTEQGNVANGGNITFGGKSLYFYTWYNFNYNTSTTAAGKNGGDIDLYGNTAHSSINPSTIVLNSTGGAGGTGGTINLPAVYSAYTYNGYSGNQSYTGGIINLYGNLTSDRGATITLNGDTRIQNNLTIRTWQQGYNASNPNIIFQTGAAGTVVISGAGVSGASAGKTLTIDASVDTGAYFANPPTNTTSFNQNGGSVSITAGNAGGYYLGSLSINTRASGTNNTGTAGAITLATVGTEGAQTYTGGTATVSGALTTNGGAINLSGVSSVALSGASVTFDTDRTGGTGNAGTLNFGSNILNSAAGSSNGVIIDLTADGGGSNAAYTLTEMGSTRALDSLNVAAGPLDVSAGVKATNAVILESRGSTSDLTLDAPVTSTAGNITLVAGRNFINNNASNTGIVASTGRYLVYSTNPSNSTEGMTGYSKHYDQTYVSGSTPAYASSGSWFVYSIAPTITISASASSITYGSADPSLTPTLVGLIDGDTEASLSGSPTLVFGSYTASGAGYRPAGTYTVTLSGSLTDNFGYKYTPFTGSLTVTAQSITATGISAVNSVYNGTRAAVLSGTPTFTTVLTGDTVSVSGSGTGTFADKNIGTGKAITLGGFTLSGADAGNYTLVLPTDLTADVTAATLTVSGASVVSKVYDTTVAATITGETLNGIFSGDTVTVSGNGTFSNKNVGTGKAVTTSLSLSGTDAGNYVLTQPTTLTGTITAATLTVSGATAQNKEYDTTAAATITGETLNGIFSGDTVTVSGGGSFSDKNVGTNKSVAGNLVLGGTDAGNYVLTQPTNLTANITAATLTVNGATAQNKIYDATTTATITGETLAGILSGDTVTISGGGTFSDKNVGTGKTVTANLTLGGVDAGNYVFAQPTDLTADITAATLTVSGANVVSKVYDTTTAATITGEILNGIFSGDTVTVSGNGTFSNKNVGTGKAVTTSLSLSGADAGNYVLTQPTTLTGTITAATLTVSGATAQNKVYDTTTAATITGETLNGILSGDTVTVSGGGSFSSKNVGTNKQVTTNLLLSGTDAGNYVLTQPTNLTANITAATLTVNGATAQNKIYDATTTATITGETLAGILSGDTVTISGGGTFSDKNVGGSKTVTANLTLGGVDAGNYVFAQPTNLTANITAKTVTVSGATAQNKTYDATTAATITGEILNGIFSGDTVAVSGNGTFSDKNVGTGKAVTTSLSLSGTDAGNYVLTQPTNLTANITAKTVTVSGATAQNKTYDATTAATITGETLNGIFSGDTVVVSGNGSFSSKNVGTNKQVTTNLLLSGTDAGNYVLTQPTNLTANITAATLTVNGATAQNKIYDATTTATITGETLAGILSGDTVTISGGGTFSDKNVGTGKTVTANLTLGGVDAGNYVFAQPTNLTANITAKTVTVSGATAQNKTYDATTAATIAGETLNGIFSGDMVAVSGNGSFSDKNVGTNKAVTTSLKLSGTDAGNYVLTQPTNLTANITAKTITVTGATAQNKTYDATTAATITGATLSGVYATDTVAVSGNGNFSDKNAGINKTVTANLLLSGLDAGNYVLTQPTGLIATITAKVLSILGTTVGSKVYDGTTSATISSAGSLNGVITSDAGKVTLSGGSAQFLDKNAGTGKSVSVTGIGLSGAEASNYVLSSSSLALTADITARPVGVTADPKWKLEGNADPTFTYVVAVATTSTGLVSGESLVGTLSRNAGETMGVYSILQGTLTNANNSNYSISFTGANLTIERPTASEIPLVTTPVVPVVTATTPITPPTPPVGAIEVSDAVKAPVVVVSSGADITITAPINVAPAGTQINGTFVSARPMASVNAPNNVVTVSIPADVFVNSDPQAVVTFRVVQENGAALPGWLHFDPSTKTLSGTAPKGANGEVKLVVVARDQSGSEARSKLTINLSRRN